MRTRTPPLRALHLPRLAQSAPGEWVQFPGSPLRVLALSPRVRETVPGVLLCLSGELVLDLPSGGFVRLVAGEAYEVGAGEWQAVATAEGTVLVQVMGE